MKGAYGGCCHADTAGKTPAEALEAAKPTEEPMADGEKEAAAAIAEDAAPEEATADQDAGRSGGALVRLRSLVGRALAHFVPLDGRVSLGPACCGTLDVVALRLLRLWGVGPWL